MPLDPVLKSSRGHAIKPFIDIEWKGDVAKKLIAASIRMKRFDILLRTIGRKVVGSVLRNIMESRTPEGQRWPGLKNPRGRGRNPDSRPLFDSGKLYESIQYVVGQDVVAVGYPGETSYGRFHQEGTRWIPARRFLGLREGDLPDMYGDVRLHIEEAFAA